MAVMSGLSGNEIYCLHLKGLRPGELVIGNSVYSTGLLGALGAGLRSMAGGEVTQVTSAIHEGREQSYERMMAEARERGGLGVTGVTSELRPFRGNIEFLSVASCIHGDKPTPEHISFSTSGDGQQLYCQLDAGYTPLKFVFGNVAYSIGIGGSLLGSLKSLGRGEIKEYSDVFNHTRHLALERIVGPGPGGGRERGDRHRNARAAVPGRPRNDDDGHRLAQRAVAGGARRAAGDQRSDVRRDVEPDQHGLLSAQAAVGHGRLFAGRHRRVEGGVQVVLARRDVAI